MTCSEACRARHSNEASKRWAAAHRESENARQQTRRAATSGVSGALTAADWAAVLDFFDHACAYCGADGKLTQDHVIPLSRIEHGPTHDRNNIVSACSGCNYSKQARLVSEWRPHLMPALVARVAPWNPALAERITAA